MASFDVVIATIGRPTLEPLLASLVAEEGSELRRVLVVDDRRHADRPLVSPSDELMLPGVEILRGRAAGPAAARNVGWRAASADWVAFLDDDVSIPDGWVAACAADLDELEDDVAASQGGIVVPLPAERPATDSERNVACLEGARWATADMAYRRGALERLGGFDERFPRAYREDSDLALRAIDAGYRIVEGRRSVLHPVRPADRWVSVRLQRGNADDALMRALHGGDWRRRAGAARGSLPAHVATVGLGVSAIIGVAMRVRSVAAIAGAAWLAATVAFASRRIASGPRDRREILTMLGTSAVIPWAAVGHRLAGEVRARRLRGRSTRPLSAEAVEPVSV
jgi:glycosyltransferase involved in cell wall biosynthesis